MRYSTLNQMLELFIACLNQVKSTTNSKHLIHIYIYTFTYMNEKPYIYIYIDYVLFH